HFRYHHHHNNNTCHIYYNWNQTYCTWTIHSRRTCHVKGVETTGFGLARVGCSAQCQIRQQPNCNECFSQMATASGLGKCQSFRCSQENRCNTTRPSNTKLTYSYSYTNNYYYRYYNNYYS